MEVRRMVQVGQAAPDFEMEAVVGDKFSSVKLSDYRGKWAVLFFWPLDFTFVCPTEVTAFSKRMQEFRDLGAEILGASIDSKFTHLAWTEQIGKVNYPMLSDITKQVSREYGVLIEEQGIALRGLFIVDPDGVLRYQVVHDLAIGRNVDEVLRVIKALQTGELCPVDWEDGMATLGSA
ncbi:MAG: peroxiredoxin [Armatimonadetes bacterium]|nr:peroxiredoxin [Armatimonadota bacterium]